VINVKLPSDIVTPFVGGGAIAGGQSGSSSGTEILAVTPDTGFVLGAGANRTVAVAKPDDEDTSYISAAGGIFATTNGTVQDSALTTQTITNVRVRARGKFITTLGEPMNIVMSDDAFTHTVTSTPALTLAYADYVGCTSATAPSGGAWTVAKVNSLVVQLGNNSDSATLRVTSWTVEVDWTSP
jgi:hypothetical protein